MLFFVVMSGLLDMEKSDAGAAVGLPRRRGVWVGIGGNLFEGVLNGVVGNHVFFEDVGAGFGRFHHFDDFAVCTAFTFLK